ncbi:unnamed protein product [Orchesella dallaii]|uniref:DUF5641 domain-containing protein n=1 Tax=Orchesella dallaii TaxID=48710 RepID=A0ABP1RYB2_9HEXA
MVLTSLDKAVADRKAQEIKLKLLEQSLNRHVTVPLCELDVDSKLRAADLCEQELMSIHIRILHTKPTAAEETANETIITDLSTRIQAVTSELLKIKATFPAPATPPLPHPATPVHRSRLPDLALPTFEGRYEEWPAFEDLFKAAIDSKPLKPCEKLQYLKTCLKGDAAQLVKAFTITDANYAEAWKIVSEQYSNKREIIFSLVEKLISQQQLKIESITSLQSLINTTMECLQSLKVMGRPIDKWDDILLVIILKKLDADTRSEWARTMKGTHPPTFKELQEFLQQHIRSLHARGSTSSKPTKGYNGNDARTTSGSHHSSQQQSTCKVCNGREHPLYQCHSFINMKIDDRISTIKKIGNCLNCLRHGHILRQCSSSSTCRKCGKQHHTMLHLNSNNEEDVQPPPPPGDSKELEPPPSHIRANTSSNHPSASYQVLLKTAIVDIEDASGIKRPVRVLLDDGSESSFITDSCARNLGLQKEKTNVYITGISGSTHAHAKWKTHVRIYSQVNDSFIDVDPLILQKVTGTLPRLACDTSLWSHLRDIRLADPYFYEPGGVEMLLGADVVASIMRDGRRDGPINTAIAQNSIFGWVVSGKITTTAPVQICSNVATCNFKITNKQWETDDLPPVQPFTTEETECDSHSVSTQTSIPDDIFHFPDQVSHIKPVIMTDGPEEENHRFSLNQQQQHPIQTETTLAFSTTAAPRHRSVWEYGLQHFKLHIRRVLLIILFTLMLVLSLLCDVEACRNNRPLSLSSYPLGLQPLTPGHLSTSDPDVKYILPNPDNPSIGDIAVINDEQLPLSKWNLPRIVTLRPGGDKLLQTTTFYNFTTNSTRPTTKLSIFNNHDEA